MVNVYLFAKFLWPVSSDANFISDEAAKYQNDKLSHRLIEPLSFEMGFKYLDLCHWGAINQQ